MDSFGKAAGLCLQRPSNDESKCLDSLALSLSRWLDGLRIRVDASRCCSVRVSLERGNYSPDSCRAQQLVGKGERREAERPSEKERERESHWTTQKSGFFAKVMICVFCNWDLNETTSWLTDLDSESCTLAGRLSSYLTHPTIQLAKQHLWHIQDALAECWHHWTTSNSTSRGTQRKQ